MDEIVSEQPNKRVLFVGLVWPEPNSTAAGQNILSYIRLFLDRGYNVTFACAADKSDHSASLKSIGVNEKEIVLNDSSFDAFVSDLKPSITVFDRFISEEQFGWRVSAAAPQSMKVLDCEDLHFLRNARHQAYKHAKTNLSDKKTLSHKTNAEAFMYSDLCKRELASIMRCDLSILLSNYECDLLSSVFTIPASIIHHCPFLLPNMTSKDSVKNSAKSFDERTDFVSIGSFRHAPNWDAVLTLKQHIWPAIHKAFPKARCHIYGSYLTPKAKQLENKKEGFLVHGFAKDAMEVIGSARVLLAPLNFGAGIKGKLVDAMQCRTPSVTTSIGSEGLLPDYLDKEHWPGAICDLNQSHDAFIESSIALYADSEAWSKASKKSDLLFSSVFNFENQSQQLMTRLDDILSNLSQHRQRHFLGQVMQHHTMSSTKYMSQWIEAKTRLHDALSND